MTFPAIIYGIILSTLPGVVFHLWKDGGVSRLVLFIVLSWLGFWSGHLAGNALGIRLWLVGSINAGLAITGSVIFLFLGEWLSRIEVSRE